jgi:hypothetical protein
MFNLPKLGLVFTFFAPLILAAPALAVDQPFSSPDAHIESGMITGSDAILGDYAGPVSADIDPLTGRITNGMAFLDFGGGDSLTFTFEGQINPTGSVTGTFTFVDGTGALAGASGGGTIDAKTDGSTFDGDLEGTLTLP